MAQKSTNYGEWVVIVVLLVVTDMVELPEPATEVGLKLAVAPLGKPMALKVTVPAKPFTAATVAV